MKIRRRGIIIIVLLAIILFSFSLAYVFTNLSPISSSSLYQEPPTHKPRIPPKVQCTDEQLKKTGDLFIESLVGEDYFNAHYKGSHNDFDRWAFHLYDNVLVYETNFSGTIGQGAVIHIAPTSPGECTGYWYKELGESYKTLCEKHIEGDCTNVWFAEGILENKELKIQKEEAIIIAKENGIRPDNIGMFTVGGAKRQSQSDNLYIVFENPLWRISMIKGTSWFIRTEKVIYIDAITEEFTIREEKFD